MEIILKEDIVNFLSYKNIVTSLSSGYGRNYLIPTGSFRDCFSFAAKKMLAEDSACPQIEKIKKMLEALAAKLKRRIFEDRYQS